MTIKILISALCLMYIYVAIKTIIRIHKDTKRADEILEQLTMELVWSQQRQESIEALEQQPKRGKWLNYLKEGLKWKCSECGSKYTTPWHYCPNCGARMESDE